MEKKCTKCGLSKSLEEFGKHKNGKLGRESKCKKCYYKRSRVYQATKKEYHKIKNAEWNKKNKKYILEYNKKYLKKRYEEAPVYKFKANTRTHINVRLKNYLKKKKGKTLDYIGCNWETYINHLESQFTSKMTWSNHGKYWEVDHIIPLSKGGTFHYTNTQPLTIQENRQKSNKML